MKKILSISIALILSLSACATYKKYDRFNDVEIISTVTTTCNRPYELSQDCSSTSGAEKNIVINDLKLAIFGNREGHVVGVMTRSVWSSGFKKSTSLGLLNDNEMIHSALGEVEKVLNQNSINIQKTVLMKSLGTIDGFFVELDGDGYSVLKRYEAE